VIPKPIQSVAKPPAAQEKEPPVSFFSTGTGKIALIGGGGVVLSGLILGVVLALMRRGKKQPVVASMKKTVASAPVKVASKKEAYGDSEEGSLSKELESMQVKEEPPPSFSYQEPVAEPEEAFEPRGESEPSVAGEGSFGGGEEGKFRLSFGEEEAERGKAAEEVEQDRIEFSFSEESKEPHREEAKAEEPVERQEAFAVSEPQEGIFRDEKDVQLRIGGEIYVCPDVKTLKDWVAEGRVVENSEVLAPNGSWVLAGTIPDLEKSFQERMKRFGF